MAAQRQDVLSKSRSPIAGLDFKDHFHIKIVTWFDFRVEINESFNDYNHNYGPDVFKGD